MKLTQPVSIGSMTLKNRIVMAPMGVDLGNYEERTRAYFLSRARGGAAMIICNTLATPEVEGPCPSALLNDESFSGFRSMVEECHTFDCKVCVQIHPGNGRIAAPPPGRDKPLGASAVPWIDPRVFCEEMTQEEIHTIQRGFQKTANLAAAAGADAIEIHGYGGYLTDQFLTKRWNIRTDEYGGDLTGRMRFLTELIEIVQQDLGKDFPLLVKFTPCHYLPESEGYRGMDEGMEIARRLEAIGVHCLHVDAGCHDNWFLAMPPIYQQEQVPQLRSSLAVKGAVSLPVMTNGRLGDISKAEAALSKGFIDIAAVGRGLLADPELPNKLMTHQAHRIRPCIACNEGCIARVCQGLSVECAVNPQTGWEGVKNRKKTEAPKKILVVGAGPGGCTAAIEAAQAGHSVELWERRESLGGNAAAAARPSFKSDMNRLLVYYINELQRLQIPVRFCKEADKASIAEYAPELVLWAAGAAPFKPDSIPGMQSPHVCTATEVLLDTALLGENIVVAGGGLVGIETAVELAQRGKRVTVIEMAQKLLPEPIFSQNMTMLMRLFRNLHISSHVNTRLLSVEKDTISLESRSQFFKFPCDTVVLAMGFRPENTAISEIETIVPVIKIGDCISPRKVYDAVHEAYDAVLSL